VRHEWIVDGDQVGTGLRGALTACWRDVSNAGGAVGFPFLPVSDDVVAPAVEAMLADLAPTGTRLLVALDGQQLLGWVLLDTHASRLVAHWASIRRLQTALPARGTGVGDALLAEVTRAAREEKLEHLVLEARGGTGLDTYYARRGWYEYGRHRGALRLGTGDDRDDVLMRLDLVDSR